MTAAASDRSVPGTGRGTGLLLTLALSYLAFVIYGSLVPLDFHYLPFSAAIEKFRHIPFLHLGIGSRADWVANLILFIPLGFLLCGLIARPTGALPVPLAVVLVSLFAIVLSGAIEFTQIYFPQRTVSQNDIYAECLGGIIGTVSWAISGPRIWAWIMVWFSASERSERWRIVLGLYVAGLFAYNVLPLDLTISPVEIYHKWTRGLIRLIPFASTDFSVVEFLYQNVVDILLWGPVGAALVYAGRKTVLRAATLTTLAVSGVELAQVFVFSRVTDTTDILTGAIGGLIGALIAKRFAVAEGEGGGAAKLDSVLKSRRLPVGSLGYLVWAITLCGIFWYPYDVTIKRDIVANAIDNFFSVPFESYYFGSEYRAITELLRKVLFFIPLGVAVSAFMSSPGVKRRLPAAVVKAGVALSLLLVPAVVEFGQIILPSHVAVSTDLVLEIAGAWIGYFLAGKLMFSDDTPMVLDNDIDTDRETATPQAGAGQHIVRMPYALIALCVVVMVGMATGLAVAIQHPSVPYNVRELFLDGPPALRALALSASLMMLGFCAALAAPYLAEKKMPVFAVLGLSLVIGLANYVLLRLSVTLESIHDIVGAPVWFRALSDDSALGGLGQSLLAVVSSAAVYDLVELTVRYLALVSPFALVLTAIVTGIWRSHHRKRGSGVGYGLALVILLVPWLYLCRLLVMNFAATDNLRELIFGGGYTILGGEALLFAVVVVMAINIAILGSYDPTRKSLRNWSIFASIVGPVCGWFLLNAGLENTITKYGITFSPLNFIFGANRNADLGTLSLFGRWLILYYGLVCVIALGVAAGLAVHKLRPRSDRSTVHTAGSYDVGAN